MLKTPPRDGDSERFTVAARDLGLRPGFDPDRINQLVDKLLIAEAQKNWRNPLGR